MRTTNPPTNSRAGRAAAVVATIGLAFATLPPASAQAQLRPLDPVDWGAVDRPATVSVSLGMGVFGAQRASLAGTEGRLLEVGTYRISWAMGRAMVELGGTAVRVFDDDSTFASPVADTRSPNGRARVDAGGVRVSTLLNLVEGDRARGALRFGVTLPTTDNRLGLERDRTDFFATLAGQVELGSVRIAGEGGIGVMGTRSDRQEQVDPILYSLSAALGDGIVRPHVLVVGQHDPRERAELRGNEDLGEARVGFTMGHDRWLEVSLVRGWRPFSPDWGLLLALGAGI